MEIHNLNTRNSITNNDFFAVDNGTDTAKYSYQSLSAAVLGDITGGASSVLSNNLTSSKVLVSNSSGKVAASSVTATELGYLSGASENIQTALTAIGTIETTGTVSSYSLTSGSWVSVCNLTLAPGVWQINGYFSIALGQSGSYVSAQVVGATSSSYEYMRQTTYAPANIVASGCVSGCFELSASTQLDLKLYSGANVDLQQIRLDAVRIR